MLHTLQYIPLNHDLYVTAMLNEFQKTKIVWTGDRKMTFQKVLRARIFIVPLTLTVLPMQIVNPSHGFRISYLSQIPLGR